MCVCVCERQDWLGLGLGLHSHSINLNIVPFLAAYGTGNAQILDVKDAQPLIV